MTITAHPGRLLWHHDAHVSWGESRLQFWFLSFRHSYDPDEVLPALHDLAIERGLTAYASYELLGPYDIMVRLYVPNGGEEELLAAVEALLKDHDLKVINRFHAVEVIRHWPWATEGGTKPYSARQSPRKPSKGTMRKRRPEREIAIINDIGRLAEFPETVELSHTYSDLLNVYLADELVTFATRKQGIRLVTIVSHPHDIERDALKNVTRQLTRVLDNSAPLVDECSLYSGSSDHRMIFMLMYRVNLEDFHSIRHDFLQHVREIVGVAGASTMTSVIVSDDVKCFADALPEESPVESPLTVLELLSADESRDFEVKGSALARLEPWLTQDAPLADEVGFFRDTILKTIAGFLNTRGGTLVVGALETRRFRGSAADKLSAFPAIGSHTCVGLMDPIFTSDGWEAYLKQISGLIEKGIDPAPGTLIEIDRESYEKSDLMVVRVEEPGDDQEYYVPETPKSAIFYARVENKTVPLRGSDIKRHMKQVIQRRNRRRIRRSA